MAVNSCVFVTMWAATAQLRTLEDPITYDRTQESQPTFPPCYHLLWPFLCATCMCFCGQRQSFLLTDTASWKPWCEPTSECSNVELPVSADRSTHTHTKFFRSLVISMYFEGAVNHAFTKPYSIPSLLFFI